MKRYIFVKEYDEEKFQKQINAYAKFGYTLISYQPIVHGHAQVILFTAAMLLNENLEDNNA